MELWIELVEKPIWQDNTKQSDSAYNRISTSHESFKRHFKMNPNKIARDLIERIFEFTNKYNRSFSPSNLKLESVELFNGLQIPFNFETFTKFKKEIVSPDMLRIVISPTNGLDLQFPNKASNIWQPYLDIHTNCEFKNLSLIIHWPGSLNIRWCQDNSSQYSNSLLMTLINEEDKFIHTITSTIFKRQIRCNPNPISKTNL